MAPPASPQNATDAVPMAVMAGLLGISAARLRQLVNDGVINRPDRGRVSFVSALRGYARTLRDAGRAGSGSEALARTHRAKATQVSDKVAARRAELMDRDEADIPAEIIHELVDKGLAAMRKRPPEKLSKPTIAALRVEIDAARVRIDEAYAKATAIALTGTEEGEE